MKRFAPAFALALVTAAAPLARAADDAKDSPYYPLKVGTTWTYKVGDDRIVIKVAKTEKVGDEMTALLEATNAAKAKLTENVAAKGDGVYRYSAEGKKIDPPVLILKLSPKKGNTWSVNSKVDGQTVAGNFVTNQADITVPAGKYKTFTAESDDLEMGGNKVSVKYYFAKDVGMVKQVVKVGCKEVTLELEKFEAGK